MRTLVSLLIGVGLLAFASITFGQGFANPGPANTTVGVPEPSAPCRNGFFLLRGRTLERVDSDGTRAIRVATLPVQVNALAYLHGRDVLLGVSAHGHHDRLVTVDQRGVVTDRGAAPKALRGAPAAAADNRRVYLRAGRELVVVDVTTFAVTSRRKLSAPVEINDWDLGADGQLYGLTSGWKPRLIRVNPTSGAVATVATLPVPGGAFGAVAIDPFQRLHALHNGTGRMYHIPLSSPQNVTYTEGRRAAYSDAARCPAAWDYGDAPSSYGPAQHTVTTFGALSIGAIVGTDDGLANQIVVDPVTTTLSVAVPVRNTTGRAASLVGWHDLNADGRFTPDERASAAVPPGGASVTLRWPKVAVHASATNSWLRLRLYGDAPSNAAPDRPASGGEVEDQPIQIPRGLPRVVPPARAPITLRAAPPPAAASAPSARATARIPAPAPRPRPPQAIEPQGRKSSRLPVFLALFIGMLVPAVTVAARSQVRGGRSK